MEQARKIAQALIMMMRDKGSNVIARGAGGRPTAIVDDAGKQIDEIPPAPQMATQLRESRQQAQDVQGPDPLAQTASDWQQDTAGMVPPGSPPITRTGNLGDPSRLPADIDPSIALREAQAGGLDPSEITPFAGYPDPPPVPSRHGNLGLPFSREAEEAGIRQAEIDAHGELNPQSALSKQEMIGAMDAEFVDLQKEFTRLAGRPPTPDEMNVGTLESLIDILKEASGEVPTPRASNLNPLDDDIPF